MTAQLLAKLGLGTVQFGMDYGVANKTGRLSGRRLDDVMALAKSLGIRVFDTAAAYGTSETALGRYLPELSDARIVTKTPAFSSSDISDADAIALQTAFAESLTKLCTTSVHGLLVHHATDLLKQGGERLWTQMKELKARGQIARIGVSVYTPAEVRAVQMRFPIDIVQLPMNLLDQRFERSGTLRELHEAGIEVHVRSVFLQGLLLMDRSELPEYFAPLRRTFDSILTHAGQIHVSVLALALNSVLQHPHVDAVLVGVDSVEQLQHIADALDPAWAARPRSLEDWASDDPHWLNPSLWKLREPR